jgi:hypothetical protein
MSFASMTEPVLGVNGDCLGWRERKKRKNRWREASRDECGKDTGRMLEGTDSVREEKEREEAERRQRTEAQSSVWDSTLWIR